MRSFLKVLHSGVGPRLFKSWSGYYFETLSINQMLSFQKISFGWLHYSFCQTDFSETLKPFSNNHLLAIIQCKQNEKTLFSLKRVLMIYNVNLIKFDNIIDSFQHFLVQKNKNWTAFFSLRFLKKWNRFFLRGYLNFMKFTLIPFKSALNLFMSPWSSWNKISHSREFEALKFFIFSIEFNCCHYSTLTKINVGICIRTHRQ